MRGGRSVRAGLCCLLGRLVCPPRLVLSTVVVRQLEHHARLAKQVRVRRVAARLVSVLGAWRQVLRLIRGAPARSARWRVLTGGRTGRERLQKVDAEFILREIELVNLEGLEFDWAMTQVLLVTGVGLAQKLV